MPYSGKLRYSHYGEKGFIEFKCSHYLLIMMKFSTKKEATIVFYSHHDFLGVLKD